MWMSVAGIAVVAVLALVIYLNNRHHGTAPAYLDFVKQDLALATAAKKPAVQDAYLAKALKNINLAAQVGQPAATIHQWRARLLTTSDSLHHITRVYAPTLLANFTQGTEIATSADSLYVLDTGKNGVYSVPSSPASSPTEIVAGGETDSNFTVGKVAQLATSGTTALVLDNNNTLVRDSSGTKTATALLKVSATQTTIGMANFGPDVYVLDPPGNQIWRYAGAVQSYAPQPSGFFAPNGPNIHNAVAFTLDDKSVYILESSGKVLKFDTQANLQTFQVSPRTPFVKPDAIFTDVGLPYVWIADPGSGQIVQIDKSGRYIRAYVSGANKLDLSQVKGIAVPTNDRWLYVLTGTQVYRLTVVP